MIPATFLFVVDTFTLSHYFCVIVGSKTGALCNILLKTYHERTSASRHCEVTGHNLSSCFKQLKKQPKCVKQMFVEIRKQAAQKSDPWSRQNKLNEPYDCPSLMPKENIQLVAVERGNLNKTREKVKGRGRGRERGRGKGKGGGGEEEEEAERRRERETET